MDEEQLEAQQLEDAAVVHATRRRIGEAVAALAVRPLDEPAAAQMRAALGSLGSARAAIARLHAADRPDSGEPTVVLPDSAEKSVDADVPWDLDAPVDPPSDCT